MWHKEVLKSPPTVESATNEYQSEMGVVGQFIKDKYIIDTTGYLRLGKKELYNAYLSWCDENSELPASQRYIALRPFLCVARMCG